MSETRGTKKSQLYALTFRLPEDVYASLARIAEREDRSLNQQAVRCIRECVARYETGPKRTPSTQE